VRGENGPLRPAPIGLLADRAPRRAPGAARPWGEGVGGRGAGASVPATSDRRVCDGLDVIDVGAAAAEARAAMTWSAAVHLRALLRVLRPVRP